MGFVDDEEEASDTELTASTPNSDEEAALLGKESPYPNESPRTPTTKDQNTLNTRRLRRKPITESEEIWDELEDEHLSFLPFLFSTPQPRRTSGFSTSNPSTKRNSRVLFEPREGITPSESTALLARPGTGRSYRSHRRRRSAPSLEARERQRRTRSAGSQEALGGWWKMNWWNPSGKEDGKGKGKGVDDPGGVTGRGGSERPSSA